MKNYFPFTDYDFYAYLTSGGLALAVLDFVFNDGALLLRPDWTFEQIVVAVAVAYVTGHIVAIPAQLLLETWTLNVVVSKPINLQLGYKQANWLEAGIGVLVGRYYGPSPEGQKSKILSAAREALGRNPEEEISPEEVFQQGFRKSFDVEGARTRIDSFLNQYGFCRNVACVGLLATILVVWKAQVSEFDHEGLVIAAAATVFIGMFIRYIKFLSSFQAEVLRTLLK